MNPVERYEKAKASDEAIYRATRFRHDIDFSHRRALTARMKEEAEEFLNANDNQQVPLSDSSAG
jgi:hypothetical protein